MTTVHLFPDEPHGPRPAWQVIDAAREMRLTGELMLTTTPMTRIYLRDGVVYFADKATDGGLGIRLVLEGVLTRAQLSNGTVLVNGAEHLGRLFERDTTVDRDAVELAVEMFVDDVLTQVAEETVDQWQIALYKRHPSGVDRWYPHVTRVLTRVVERTAPPVEVPVAPERAAVAPDATAPQPQPAAPLAAPVVEPVIEPLVEPVVEPLVEAVTPPEPEVQAEPEVQPEAEVQAEPEVHNDAEPDAQPVAEVQPEPASEAQSLPAPAANRLISADTPTNVVPVLPVDTLLQPRLATGDQPVVATDAPAPLDVSIPELDAIERLEDIADIEPEPVVTPVSAASNDELDLVDAIKAAVQQALAGAEH